VKITISLGQLNALEAADKGTLRRGSLEHDRAITGSRLGIWRIDGGRAITISALILIDRGLIAEGPANPDGTIPAIVTGLGREVLDELASRQP
jgi:hypothetical protein